MEKIEKLIEEIDSLTVVELNDLVKAIEEKQLEQLEKQLQKNHLMM